MTNVMLLNAMPLIVLGLTGGLLLGFGLGRRNLKRPIAGSDNLIEQLLDQSPLPVTVSSLAEGRILKANQHFAACLELEADALKGRTSTSLGLLSSATRAEHLKLLELQACITVDLKDLNAQLYRRHFQKALIVKTSYHDEPVLLATYLRLNEHDRTASERLLLALAMEKLNEVVIITDRRGVIQYVNPNFTPMTGLGAEDTVGRFISSLAGLTCSEGMLNGLMQVLNRTGSWEGQHYIKDLSEQRHLVQANVTRVDEAASGEEHYIIVCRDITETAQLERALSQAQRLEAIGTLAAGIAHDLNNALMPIMGYAELGLDEVGPQSTAGEYFEIIQQSSQRCKEMVQHILRSSRTHEPQPQAVRIQSIIKETVKLLRFSLPPSIELVHGLDEHCRAVLIDPTQLYQVIMNLGTNAYHAMRENGGNIFIYLTEIAVDASKAPLEQLKPGIYAKLAVIDTGTGIAPDIKAKVFEPFFSTRSAENGTGMGLYITNNIIKAHGGCITIDSQPGGGTAVNVYLPCLAGDAAAAELDSSLNPLGGTERILIVDDEVFVAEMLKTMISRLGYQITLAHSAQDGLERFTAAPQNFDLVITDHDMPDTNGLKLAQAIAATQAQVPVILITGLNDSFDEHELRRHGVKKVLYKPIALRVIACAIRGELDQRAPT